MWRMVSLGKVGNFTAILHGRFSQGTGDMLSRF